MDDDIVIASWDLEALQNAGERVTHLVVDNVYNAHLSIYQFAAPYCRGRVLLDAGAGAGYGAAYLAEAGALRVQAIDYSADAVAFSREHFARPNLHFALLDLGLLETAGFADGSFDVIFSSNVLEHLADVPAFLRAACRLLRPDGLMIVAVPPITDTYLRAANLVNPHHLQIWSPRQWSYVLGRYFGEVEYFLHCLGRRGAILDFHQPPPELVPPEAWIFERVTLDELASIPTLSAVFVLRAPRALHELPVPGEPMRWVDASFSRQEPDPLAEELAAMVVRQQQQIAAQAREAVALEQRIGQLEREIGRKNAHIEACEQFVRQLESGRVMRVLRRLDGWRGRGRP
jgi:2-polyprenyl-3-methyl-5-hydroxy-6-metoxy-1,4-benzoquinol methylase